MRTSNLLIAALLAGAMSMPMAMAATPETGAGGAGGGTTAAPSGAGGAPAAKSGAEEPGGATAAKSGASEAGGGATANEQQANAVANGTGAALTISPSGVREVQKQLNRLGYAAGSVDGTWNRATATAMTEFQRARGLDPTGNLNIGSIAALGLWGQLIGNPNGRVGPMSRNNGTPPARGQGGSNGGMGGYGGGMGMNGGYGGVGMNRYGGGGMAAGQPSQRINNGFSSGSGNAGAGNAGR